VGSRNKQRPTFEKRQREIARQERQAEKRARRRARAEGLDLDQPEPDADAPAFAAPPGGVYPDEIGMYEGETKTPATDESVTPGA
jgi:hypothetical protein